MSAAVNDTGAEVERKRRAKRNALLLGFVAIGFYVLFVTMTVFGK